MQDKCIHHYKLTPPDGPTSIGVCKKCGASKEFSNAPVHEKQASFNITEDVQEELDHILNNDRNFNRHTPDE